MTSPRPTLHQKLQNHFNTAAGTNKHYAEMFGMILAHNKDRLGEGKLEVPFSYMDRTFGKALDEANRIVREHKGPAV